MTNKFNIGDKVRILNAIVLAGNRFNVSEGKEYEILSFHEKTDREVEHIKVADNHSNPFTICDWEYKYIDRVVVELSEKQRISKLEEEVAEMKLIVAQIRKPSTVVEEALANDIIEFEGKQYKKVDREAREGDVIIFRNNQESFTNRVTSNKPYPTKYIEEWESLRFPNDDYEITNNMGDYYQVYNSGSKRTRETVDVYELIVEDKQDIEPPVPKTQNELRAEIIEKAKGFVESAISRGLDENELKGCAGNHTYKYHHYTVDFSTKNNKVVSLVYRSTHVGIKMDKKPRHIGRAKCNPSDVFNEHIGKAIALGRALGLDVSEFEQAVQPTHTSGQECVIKNWEGHNGNKLTLKKPMCYGFAHDYSFGWLEIDNLTIINDTKAIYKED